MSRSRPSHPSLETPASPAAKGSPSPKPWLPRTGSISATGRLSVTRIVPPGVSLLWASAPRRRLTLTSTPMPGWVAVRVRTTLAGRRELAFNGKAVRDLLKGCNLYQESRKVALPVVIAVRSRSASDIEFVVARAQVIEVWQ